MKKVYVPTAVPFQVAFPIAPYSAVSYAAPAPIQVQAPLPQPQYQQPIQYQPQGYAQQSQVFAQQQAAVAPCAPCCVPCCQPCPPVAGAPQTPNPGQPWAPVPGQPQQPTPADPPPVDPPGPSNPPGGAQAVTEIFVQSCIKCHGATNPKGGLDLTLPVDNRDLAAQIFLRTFSDTPGIRMPPDGGLTDEQRQVIFDWANQLQTAR